MAADHSSYEELAQQRRGSEDYQQGHAEARRAFLIGHHRSSSPPVPA